MKVQTIGYLCAETRGHLAVALLGLARGSELVQETQQCVNAARVSGGDTSRLSTDVKGGSRPLPDGVSGLMRS